MLGDDPSYRFLGTWRAGRSNWRLQVLSVFSLAVAFVCLASALLVVTNLAAVRDRWSRAGRATVYLKDDVSPEDVSALVKALESTAGITRVRYVSSEDARHEIVNGSGDEQLAALPANAFPSTVELAFANAVDDRETGAIALKLRALRSVDTVETYQRWTEKLSALLTGGVTASVMLALVVFAAVASVVGSTMRLLLEKRKVEIEVLKLVGATARFVSRPFIVEGAVQGIAGAVGGIVLSGLLYSVVRGRFDDQLATLVGVSPVFLPLSAMALMIAVGGILGASASWLSLRKAVQL
ncbi:MAG: FtsX-like permease family protein [Myxococcales bacterium]|nr:FtsX-like permease family protein [Myxococcales bacterium]